ncbi:MAG: acyltransferase [Proteobacteria bacterium]|nr:acyltransferase [Pseudomonadota bacterium]
MSSENSINKKTAYYPALDGLRTLAVSFVILGHVVDSSCLYRGAVAELAKLGVQLFFVLSGFLITQILLAEELRNSKIDIKNFYFRRILRIVPAFYFLLFVVFILILLGYVTDVNWKTFIVSALFLRNIFGSSETLGHTWSLGVEEQFYVIWPILLKYVKPHQRLIATLVLAISVMIFRDLTFIFNPQDYTSGIIYMRPYYRFDSLMLGCAIAIFIFNGGIREKVVESSSVGWMVVALLLIWSVLAKEFYFGRIFYLSVQNILCCILLLYLLKSRGILQRVFSFGLFKQSAKYSYSLYLWQQIFLFTKTPDWGMLREFPINIALACLMAVFSYHCIEKPFLNLRDKLK